MRLLFDQNISPRILKHLPSEFSGCTQVRFVGLEDEGDFQIFQFAKSNDFCVVTFDSDFVDLNTLYGTPPRIIWLNTGNLSTQNISSLILNNILIIRKYIEEDTDSILELIK